VGRLRPIFVITRSILWAGVLRYSLSCQFGVELQYCRWFEGGKLYVFANSLLDATI